MCTHKINKTACTLQYHGSRNKGVLEILSSENMLLEMVGWRRGAECDSYQASQCILQLCPPGVYTLRNKHSINSGRQTEVDVACNAFSHQSGKTVDTICCSLLRWIWKCSCALFGAQLGQQNWSWASDVLGECTGSAHAPTSLPAQVKSSTGKKQHTALHNTSKQWKKVINWSPIVITTIILSRT